ncbi:MAG: alpha-L-rhamnosidase N-terminal domain-containing protein [Pseudomonadota bacterium]
MVQQPRAAEINITVDGRYQAFLNGQRIGRGPARCSPLYQRYDTYGIADFLNEGENALAVLIRVFGKDMSWYEKTEGLWNPVFGDGGLWVSGYVETSAGLLPLKTDERWSCFEVSAWQQDTPQSNHGLGFIEVLDGGKLPVQWTEPGFDDANWDSVQVMEAGGGGPEAFFGGLISRPFPHLLPNRLKPLHEEFVAPKRVQWVRETTTLSDVALYDEPYNEPLGALDRCSAVDLEDCLAGEGTAEVKTVHGHGVSFLLDFERLQTIYPLIEMEAKGGEIIDIVVNERLPDEWGGDGPSPESRIVRTPLLGLDAHMSRYIAKPGRQTFERFEWQAAIWMQVTIRNADDGIVLHRIGGTQTHYPVEPLGHFTCSDPLLTKLWETGRYTLQLCMHDGWEDCPSREQRQWLGDATVENLVGHAAFGPGVEALNAEFIRKCAESQRPDGLTQMFAPGNHGTNGLLIPDWTLQWILNTADHLRLTDDLATIEEVFPSIQKALQWFERSTGASGLVANMAYWHFMDWSGVGREGEACTLNAQLAGCYVAAADMADALEMSRVASRYRNQAANIQAALNARHWDEARGVYVDCVDPETATQDKRVSQHANAAMILWGDAPRDRWARMIAWITDPDRITFTAAPPITPEGATLDPHTGVVMANTFYAHFLFEALAKAWRNDLLFTMIRERYTPMIEAGATTLWESFEPTASLCHGFSASPTWQMSARILGITRIGSGNVHFAPDLLDLSCAEGVVPVKEGDIEVRLRRENDGFAATLKGPTGLNYSVAAPQGHRLASPSSGTFGTVPTIVTFSAFET